MGVVQVGAQLLHAARFGKMVLWGQREKGVAEVANLQWKSGARGLGDNAGFGPSYRKDCMNSVA